MKRHSITVILCVLLLLLPAKIHGETMDGPLGNGNSPGESVADKKEEEKNDKENSSTSDFISGALMSLDEETRKKEVSQDYIQNFYSSSMTAKTKGLNLFDGDSIVMSFLNLITSLFEMIGIAVTFFVMLLYNLVSSSFLSTIIQSSFDTIDAVLFDWDDPNSWISKLLLLMALFSILYQLIKNFTKFAGWKYIVQLVFTTFLSMCFITFIGQYGRPLINTVEKNMNQLLVETFIFGEKHDNPEIINKQNIFDILQRQPFMVRHYGTVNLESIAGSNDVKAVENVEKRVQKLLESPSQDNAEIEYDKYKNHVITHDSGSAAQISFLSFILLVHRFAISIVIGAICLGLGAVKAAKSIILGLSVYQLIWWLMKRTNKARQWFLDRIIWCAVTVIVDILFSSALFFLVDLCAKTSAKNVLLMLAVDAILIVLLHFVMKNFTTISTKLKEDGKVLAEAMFLGNASPIETFQKMRDTSFTENANSDMNDTNDRGSSSISDDPFDHDLRDCDDPFDGGGEDDQLRDTDVHDFMQDDTSLSEGSDEEDVQEEQFIATEDVEDSQQPVGSGDNRFSNPKNADNDSTSNAEDTGICDEEQNISLLIDNPDMDKDSDTVVSQEVDCKRDDTEIEILEENLSDEADIIDMKEELGDGENLSEEDPTQQKKEYRGSDESNDSIEHIGAKDESILLTEPVNMNQIDSNIKENLSNQELNGDIFKEDFHDSPTSNKEPVLSSTVDIQQEELQPGEQVVSEAEHIDSFIKEKEQENIWDEDQ